MNEEAINPSASSGWTEDIERRRAEADEDGIPLVSNIYLSYLFALYIISYFNFKYAGSALRDGARLYVTWYCPTRRGSAVCDLVLLYVTWFCPTRRGSVVREEAARLASVHRLKVCKQAN